ncbi:hypothetical protein F4803DRAFT_38510 [Xylaria telfairii]|nr:hypothetical protein F4803DRAFT_38510 [Xylaria telfairii]
MRWPRDMTTDVSEDDRAWQEDEDQGLSNKASVIPTRYARSVGAYSTPRPGHPNQQYSSNPYRQFNRGPFVNPAGHLPFPPRWTQLQVIHIGDGMTVAGQSSEDFATRFRVSLCYQCCKRISLRTLISTRRESCGATTCSRTREIGLEFIPMPKRAADACEEFRTFLIWWMDKVDLGVDEAIEKRSRNRVQEVRDDIPDATSYGS